MFYSVDLLTLRRNGKFTKCWLAANLSPTIFHNKFRRRIIAAIDVKETCDELIAHVNTERSQRRFSLYLSAQLMYGVTRILNYKADACLKENLQLWKDNIVYKIAPFKEEVGKKKRKKLPDLLADQIELPPPEESTSVYPRPHLVDNADRITLKEADMNLREYEWMMRDADENFGALTGEQMDAWLDHDGLQFGSSPSSLVRALPETGRDDTLFTFKIPQSSPQRISREAIVDVGQITEGDIGLDKIPELVETVEALDLSSVIQPRDERTRTPVKHKLSPTTGVGTPSKKIRGPEAEEVEESSNFMTLESLDSSVFQTQSTIKKPRNPVTDEHKKIPHRDRPVIQRKNWKIPKKLIYVRVTATKLLTTPSTQPAWGKPLRVLFDMMLLEPISAELSDRRPAVGDAVRVPADISEQSKQLSTFTSEILPKSTTSVNVSDDRTKPDEQDSIQKHLAPQILPPLVDAGPNAVANSSSYIEAIPELPAEEPQQPSLEEPQQAPLEEPQQPPLDISTVPKNIRQIIGDWVPGIVQPFSPIPSSSPIPASPATVDRIDSSKESSRAGRTSCSGTNWVKADILGMLEVLWSAKRVVKFKDICHPFSSTRKDASQVFTLLLELHKSKEVQLTQATPFADIYIYKYSPNY